MADDIVKLTAVPDEVQGQRLQQELLEAGIPSLLRSSDMLSVAYLLPPPPFSLWLYVRSGDVERAREVLGGEEGPSTA